MSPHIAYRLLHAGPHERNDRHGRAVQGRPDIATRRVAIVDKLQLSVVDEVTAGLAPANVRRTMLTGASVARLGPRLAELRKDGKRLRVYLDAPVHTSLVTWPTTPRHAYDAANPGTTLLGFETNVTAGAVQGAAHRRQRCAPAMSFRVCYQC